MGITKITEVSITALKYEVEDDWLKEWAEKQGREITKHPLYLALRGDIQPLNAWCKHRQDIFLMERLDLVLDVYRSLIRYGQLEPIEISRDNVIITGHKRAVSLLIMGKEKIKAVVC